MKFHTNTEGREGEVKALWRACFPEDSEAYLRFLMAKKYDPALCRAFEEDGKLVALLHLLPLKLRVADREVDLPFVYGAGTLPAHRKRGYMRELLRETFRFERENGRIAIALYPFQYGFYRKAGFGLVDECAAMEMKAEDILSQSRFWEEQPHETAALSAADMLAVWARAGARFAVFPVRTADRCEARLAEWESDGGSSLCCRREGKAVGYALFSPLSNRLEVEEICYADGAALQSLLLALAGAAKSADCESVRCELPRDEFPHHLFADSRKGVYLEPHAMFRALDVERLLDGLPTPAAGGFCLQVEDELCPWNSGAYTVICDNGEMRVKRGGTPDAWCGVAALSSLVCGSVDGETAKTLGLLKMDNPAAAKAFPRRKGFFFEHY